MIGCAKKGQWELIKYVLLIPIYWIMISVAGGIAFFQLIFKPHYWEKTVHGLHLNRSTAEIIIELGKTSSGFSLPIKVKRQVIKLLQLKIQLFGRGQW